MIKQQSIEALKDYASITQVVSAYVSLDKHGKACCPFHQERSASFSVDEKKQITKCFGCGEGGDVFEFVKKIENVDFPEAVEEVARIVGFTLEYEELTPEVKKAKDELTQMFDFNAWLAGVFGSSMVSSKAAKKYLEEKRKYSLEDAVKMELGYAPDSFDFIKNKCIDNGTLPIALKLGVVKESEKGNIYDFWRDRLMFPIKDRKGRVTGFAGRYIGDDEAIQKKSKYINSASSAIFNKDISLYGIERAAKEIRKTGVAHITEGHFDVTSAHLVDMMNVVATGGVSLSKGHLHILKGLGAKIIYLLRDNDPAGKKANMRDIDVIAENGLLPYVCTIKGGAKDLDEKIIQEKNRTEEVEKEIEEVLEASITVEKEKKKVTTKEKQKL